MGADMSEDPEARFRYFTWRAIGEVHCLRVCIRCAEQQGDPALASTFQFVLTKMGKRYLICTGCGRKEELK